MRLKIVGIDLVVILEDRRLKFKGESDLKGIMYVIFAEQIH